MSNKSQSENIFQCWNYTNEQLRCLVEINTGSYRLEEDAPHGLSQTSTLNYNEDSDYNNGYIFADINGVPLAHETNESYHVT